MYYGSLQLVRTGNSAIQKLFSSKQMGKASYPANRVLEAGH